MAPIRRYLRISKYSVLECRIFLENPADGPRWLLNPQDPALPRVFEAIRPLVLPKLREENEKAKGKGKKKKSVKDVVIRDDFEVSIFLTEIGTRHSLLAKSKTFKDAETIGSNTNRLTGSNDRPMMIQEESDDETNLVPLDGIPIVDEDLDEELKRSTKQTRAERRGKEFTEEVGEDDKKKLAFKTSYEGFSIWGWVLCLLVERKGGPGRKAAGSDAQALMAEWITSTQQREEDR